MYNRKHKGGTEKAGTKKKQKKTKWAGLRHETPGLKMSPTPALSASVSEKVCAGI